MEIRYERGGVELLDRVKPLWEQLNELHRQKSPHFKRHYEQNTFEKRKKPLLAAAQNGGLYVALAYDDETLIGYCISSAAGENGEIDSIFVESQYRGMGIAGRLLDMSLEWLEQSAACNIIIKVGAGNEEVFGFYATRGFFPRATELRRVEEKNDNPIGKA